MRIEEQASQSVIYGEDVLGLPTIKELHTDALRLGALGRRVLVDCTATERMDCSALQLFAALDGELQGRGQRVQILHARARLREYCEMAGFGWLLNPGANGAPAELG